MGVDRPVPHSTRPPERTSAVATFSATWTGWQNWWGMRTTPNPRRRFFGRLGQRADDDLGGGRVRAALTEVVLDVPDGVEAQGVGQLDLLERLGVGLLLGLALAPGVLPRPRLGHVDLVQQVELQPPPPCHAWRSIYRTPDPDTEQLLHER